MNIKRIILPAFFSLGMIFHSYAQQNNTLNPNDSLSLPQILKTVLETHPAVLKAEEAINSAVAGTALARSGYYPVIDGVAGYTRIDPVPEVTIPGLGSLSFAPHNNYNLSIDLHESIYDFGKTSGNIRLSESSRRLSEKNAEGVKQRLVLVTSIAYYNLIYLQDALEIKENQIATLEKHLEFVTKKEETGSSTQYEILSTRVRLSNAQNQKVDLELLHQTQQSTLNSLLGLPVTTNLKVVFNLSPVQTGIRTDSLIPFALLHRNEMEIARLREEHARIRLSTVKSQNTPAISAFASGGFKNGYFPDLNKFQLNWAGGVGINVPIFDATRHKSNLKIARSDISISQQDLEDASRNISSEVFQNQLGVASSLQKIDQGKLQVLQAEEALRLANISFSSGSLTNLDLLDAERALEESRIMLLRAEVDYAINVVKLNISIGRP